MHDCDCTMQHYDYTIHDGQVPPFMPNFGLCVIPIALKRHLLSTNLPLATILYPSVPTCPIWALYLILMVSWPKARRRPSAYSCPIVAQFGVSLSFPWPGRGTCGPPIWPRSTSTDQKNSFARTFWHMLSTIPPSFNLIRPAISESISNKAREFSPLPKARFARLG